MASSFTRMLSGVAVCLAVVVVSLAAQEFPAPVGKVNDFAKLLKTPERQQLEAELAALERDTTAEVAVVTVDSLDGRPVEDYANRLFAEWGIGKKGKDNGVLILVAQEERTMRIEVGYGLEPILPDGLAGAIIRETFTPRFRDGDYAQGIREGTARVAEIIRKNEALTAEQRAALDAAEREAQQGSLSVIVAFLALFVGVGAMVLGHAIGTKTIAPILPGLLFTGMPLWFALLAGAPVGLGLLVLFAIVILVLSFRHGRRQLARGKVGRAGRGWILGASGASGGSGRSGGGSSSSSSSGGSFGGGRSGGGGASGRW